MNARPTSIYAGTLGKGEASCIAAAKEQGLIVITDDRAARRYCS